MKITLNKEFNESEYAVKAFKASRAMQIEAAAILKTAVHRLEDLSDRHADDGGYISHDRAMQLSIGFHNYHMAALRKLEPRPILIRQVKHVFHYNTYAAPTPGTWRYFLANDILCGDPIGAPGGAQLPTEGEDEIEQARR